MTKDMALALISEMTRRYPNYPMSKLNLDTWAGDLMRFQYSKMVRDDLVTFIKGWQLNHPPGIAHIISVVRQSNEKEEGMRNWAQLEPPRTKEQESVAEREMAKVWKILGGKKGTLAVGENQPVNVLQNWVQDDQCPNPDCLDRHTAADCPRRK